MSIPTSLRVICAVSIAAAAHAQSPGAEESFKVGADVRTRFEQARGGAPENGVDRRLMTRLRLWGLWRPASNVTVRWEAQDSGLSGARDRDYADAFTNRSDLRIAAVEWSSGGPKRWRVAAGRQEYGLGEERLIGSDTEWCNLSRSFDGIRMEVSEGAWQAEAFHFNIVEPAPRRLDRPFGGPRLAGGSVSYESEAGGWSVKPFGVYASGLEIYTTGGLMEMRLGPRVRSWSEMAFQTGRSVRSWAGIWGTDLELTLGETANAVVGASYAHASGDSHSGDGFEATFHDLYPAGYNSCGMLDPFAWRNLDDTAITFEWPMTSKLTLQMENHAYWLATTRDGLYVDGGAAVHRQPAARSRYLGDQVNVGATVKLANEFALFVSGARLTGGGYMQQAGMAGSTTVAIGLRWQRQGGS